MFNRFKSGFKRFWLNYGLEIREGTGVLLCVLGVGLLFSFLPNWLLGALVGGGSIFAGVQLLKR